MNLDIEGKLFVVCGATSGFGQGIAKQLLNDGANIIAVARNEEKLGEFQDAFSKQVDIHIGDITESKTIQSLKKKLEGKAVAGILVNAGGPPAMSFIETKLTDWDEAYRQLVRWKVEITQTFLPGFIQQNYGRFLYIESSSVKQPIENLVLSTAMRLSVVGFVKTLSQEVPDKGVTFNIMAPGFHETPAIERLVGKKAEIQKISRKEAKTAILSGIPMKKMGNVENFGSLGAWLLSPLSEYITGQVFTLDGGVVKSTL